MMRKFFRLSLMVSGVLLGGLLTSCSNEMDSNVISNSNKSVLLKAPKVVAYSGNKTWGNSIGTNPLTRSSDTQANMWYESWDCFPTTDNLTEEDIKNIIQRLSIGRENTYNTVIIPFKNYWVQQVYKGTDEYVPTDIFGDKCTGMTIVGSDFMDHLEDLDKNGNSERIENFEHGTNNNNPGLCQQCHQSLAGTVLKTDMATENIDPTTQFGYQGSYGIHHNYNNYYIIEYKGYYYLGFDYEMHKDANNPNEAKDVARDWNFTDWIVRIVPAYGVGETPLDNPGGIQDGDWYEGTGGGVTTPDPDPDPTPDPNPNPNPGPNTDDDDDIIAGGDDHTNEVEVNLAVDDKDGKYNESHLSIHVRSAANVDVFIPVPLELVCPADDMEIVKKHFEGESMHGGEFQNATIDENGNVIMNAGLLSRVDYQIADWNVSLYVEYVEAGYTSSHGETFSEAGIHVWTEGICAELIEYLEAEYGDGITFEIWNYYSEDSTLDELKTYLDNTVISFLGFQPDYYINAFGRDNYENEKDCTVNLDSDTSADYEYVGEGGHLNGSSHNEIYKKRGVTDADL